MNGPRAQGEHRGERQGVVAVCLRGEQFLVIERSQHVEAPGALCFPGGGIEAGEDEATALRRELREELECEATLHGRLWTSRTDWGVQLAWWQVSFSENPRPNEREVASILWLSEQQMRASPKLLTSNIAFLDALRDGEVSLHRDE